MQKTALLFSGQGAQSVGMGKDLAEQFPTVRRIFDQANNALGYDLATVCHQGPEDVLTKTEHAQPGIFLVSWAALALLQEQCPNLSFQATAGLSLGEFTALAAAEAFSFTEGLKVVHERGRFMQEACEATQGGMAAILGLDEATTRAVCDEAGVALANLNCPGQLVISGESSRIAHACELAQLRGAKRALPLTVAGAYHSPLMASAQPKLDAVLASIPLTAPTVTVVSNVTALPHDSTADMRRRLVEQVTAPVRWEASVRFLIAQGFTSFIEIGPGNALTSFMKRIDRGVRMLNVADVPSLESTLRVLA